MPEIVGNLVTITVRLDPNSNAKIEIKMTFTGLLNAEYTVKLFKFMSKIKEESGIFPDAEPDIFTLPGTEKENIGRRFELDTTLGAVDPINFPDWKVTCEVIRKGSPDKTLDKVEDSGTFNGSNLAKSKIIIYFSSQTVNT